MRFSVDGTIYILEFSRSKRQITFVDRGAPVNTYQRFPSTTLTLLRVIGKTPELKEIVEVFRSVAVSPHHRDRFTLEKGRMNALKLMSKGTSLSKAFKRKMWDCYMNRGMEGTV